MTHEELLQCVHYNPNTGEFTWLVWRPGQRAGSFDGRYWYITIKGIKLPASQWAWFYMTGSKSDFIIDHINRRSSDDTWCNLREATQSQNKVNRIYDNEFGRGVKFNGYSFTATITVNSRKIYLGSFDNAKDAHATYDEAVRTYHGNFVPT